MQKRYYLSIVAAILLAAHFNFIFGQKTPVSGTPFFEILAGSRENEDYVAKTIIIKLKQQYRSSCSNTSVNLAPLQTLMQELGVKSFAKIYPMEKPPQREYNERGQKLVDLSLIYEYVYTADLPLQPALYKMSSLGLFEYAEPHVIHKFDYTVNDPSVGSQYHIALVKAPQAWDISQGDTNVVIGIVDSGTEPTHPDLKNNIKHNYKDPINGVDDDKDGLVDNFSGWDLGMDDNDPTFEINMHGVHVGGIAAATTDNSTGVAGTGFKCKFLPVKIADSTGKIFNGYTGMHFAATQGCKVINCSWGGSGGGQYGQDIVNNVTFNYDALVVCSAGNTGDESQWYPTWYQNVLSVGSTGTTDVKSVTSSYGYAVRISAPGENIYSTWGGASYIQQSGTSMSAPCVSGAAGIVRSYFPNYSAVQAAARLCVTADNIDSKNSSALKNKMGTGRLNIYRALTDPGIPSVAMTTRAISDANDEVFLVNDTLRISGIFTNYLSPTSNLTATISSTSTFVTLISGSTVATLGAIGTMATANNTSKPFKVKIKAGTPQNTTVIFKVTYSDGTYSAVEFFSVIVNVDYLNVTVNDISTSVTSKGAIGWNNDPPTIGLGFKYLGNVLMYDAGFLVGVPDSSVSNTLRGVSTRNTDFTPIASVKRISTGALSDFDTETYFSDAASPKALPVRIHQKAYAWSTVGDTKYIMYRYIIRNNGTSTLNNLYAGICADFDVQSVKGDSNRVAFDSGNKMGYTFFTKGNSLHAGIKLLSNTAPVNVYGFDNVKTGNGGIDPITSGFSRLEKYTALSTPRTGAGLTGQGNDVFEMVSTGPLTINAGDSVEVAFAMLAGDNLSDLQTSAINAQAKYNNVVLSAPLLLDESDYALQCYPNPTGGNTLIEVTNKQTGKMELQVVNLLGQTIATIASGEFLSGKHQFVFDASKLSNGVYYFQLVSAENKLIRKMVVSK